MAKDNLESLRKFERIISLVGASIGALVSVLGIIKSWDGSETSTSVLLGGGLVLVLICLTYVALRRVRIGESLGVVEKRFVFTKRIRVFSWVGIIGVLLAICVIYFLKKGHERDGATTIVAVADFDGPRAEEYLFSEIIIDKLRKAVEKYDDLKIRPLNSSFNVDTGSEFARALGGKSGAKIVLWGWYGATPSTAIVNYYYELLQPPKERYLKSQAKTSIMSISELESFKFQMKLSDEMSYVTLLTVGLSRYEQKDYPGAISRFDDALLYLSNNETPNDMINPMVIYLYRGLAYSFNGDYDQAISDFKTVIQLSPEYAGAYHNLGELYARKGNFEEALNYYNRVLNFSPKDSKAYNNRGVVYRHRGESIKAINDFDAAISNDPENAAAYYNRGLVFEEIGNLRRANTDFDRAKTIWEREIKTDAHEPAAYFNHSLALRRQNDHKRADDDSMRAIQLDSTFIQRNLVELMQLATKSRNTPGLNMGISSAISSGDSSEYDDFIVSITQTDDSSIKLFPKSTQPNFRTLGKNFLSLSQTNVDTPVANLAEKSFDQINNLNDSTHNVAAPRLLRSAKSFGVGQITNPDPIEGTVETKILIDETGKVRNVVVLKSDDEIFNQPAILIAQKMEFLPATRNGVPITVWVMKSFHFRFVKK